MATTQTSLGTEKQTTDHLAKLRIPRAAPRPPRSRLRGWVNLALVVLVLLALAAGVGLWAVRSGWISTDGGWMAMPEMIQPRPEVRLATMSVESGRAADATVVATGYLESRRQAKIGARAPGRIEVVNVEEGSRVEPGQVLAILEHADLEASLSAAIAMRDRTLAEITEQEVLIAQWKRAFDRAENLRESRGVSDKEYDDAKFGFQGAQARLASLKAAAALAEARVREAEQMKANMFIRAPFSGTVISKDAEVGESILPGGMGEASGRGSVVTVADLEHLEVDCDVKEDYISRVESGQSAEVAVDAVPERRYHARVRKIIPMGDRARATIKVKVEITDADERLFPEMSATVYFLPPATAAAAEEPARKRVLCEEEAVHKDGAGSYVWTINEQQRLQRVAVKTGPARDGRVEITEGLSGSEQVVVGPPGLKAGQLAKLVF
jgi:RND family efflux transporter MFP subunit